MHRSLIVAAAVAALTLAGAGIAVAQDNEQSPSCAESLSVYLDARAAFEKLPEKIDNPALVKLAENVESATTIHGQRQAALSTARTAAENVNASQPETPVGDDRASVRARIDAIEDYLKTATTDKADHETELAARNAELKAIDTLASAQTSLDSATKAQADAPRKVDNPALKAGKEFDAVAKAQTAADKACEGQPGDPGPVGPPAADQGNNNNGSTSNGGSNNGGSTSNGTSSNPGPITYSQVETVPSGGVETGA